MIIRVCSIINVNSCFNQSYVLLSILIYKYIPVTITNLTIYLYAGIKTVLNVFYYDEI